jgi:hypothetical protein
MSQTMSRHRTSISRLAGIALLLLPAAAMAQDKNQGWDFGFDDLHFGTALALEYSNGGYGTPRNTNVEIALPAISVESSGFKFTASLPYERISGRGLVIFDSVGNPVVINRRSGLPPDVRTGWGDLNLSASYTVPSVLLDGFDVKVSALTKVPTGSARRRLSTGEEDYGFSVDVSRKYGAWGPFVTFGYLVPGSPAAFVLYDTTSISAGTTLELTDTMVAAVSYDWDSASTPLVPASHELFGSLSWVGNNDITVTAYTTAGLSDGSPNIGGGLVLSYGFN